MRRWIIAVALGSLAGATVAGESATERGRNALTGKTYIPAIWSRGAYDKLWTRWAKEKPADYDAAVREVYGLHPAPYSNGGLPMGLRNAPRFFQAGLAIDCLACHGGAIHGQSTIGLGNSSLDVQAVFEDLNIVDNLPGLPFRFSNTRGTSEAGTMSVYLIGKRHPDLSFRAKPVGLALHDDQCEDVPAWWLLKKKKTMYFTGGSDARSVRSMMQFMMGSIVGPNGFAKAEADFADIRQYMLSLEPPKYPYPVDAKLAAQGAAIFRETCARCHGTYGANWTYPNKIVPLAEIGTDPKRYEGITQAFGDYYDTTWFAQAERGDGPAYKSMPTDGYQAPPLDGLWATAPYLHNGCAPTVYHVLNSKARPAVFTRSFKTGAEDYDPVKLGWKYRECRPADASLPPRERRKVYDTSQPGRSNAGHTYGDDLTEPQRLAVIEYLKTI